MLALFSAACARPSAIVATPRAAPATITWSAADVGPDADNGENVVAITLSLNGHAAAYDTFRGCRAEQFRAYSDGPNADTFVCPGELTWWEAKLVGNDIVVTRVDHWFEGKYPIRREELVRIPTVATVLVFPGDEPPHKHDDD